MDNNPVYATLDDWITKEAIPFSAEQSEALNAAVDKMMASIGPVELLGFGEALHGGEDILLLRNRLFQHLVEAHGYIAIAVESNFPRGHLVDEYIAGRGPATYEDVQEAGISHGWGKLEANRELIEWMRSYNADPPHSTKLHFYGFDSPTEMYYSDSPRQVLQVAIDYLASLDAAKGEEFRGRIDPLLGEDAPWENPAAMMDPTQSIGLSPAATALRIETEELISELCLRRPELIGKSGEGRYLEALEHAKVARWLLTYHAAVARPTSDRFIRLLGLRDALMADNLLYIVRRWRSQGRVLAFAHNSHLRRGQAHWQLGEDLHIWSPAGMHLAQMLGRDYAVIGLALGVSELNGIGEPEPGTLEQRLTASPGPVRFIPTRQGIGLPAAELETLTPRTGSRKNPSYFTLTKESLSDFDWLAVLDSTTYSRGGPVLEEWVGRREE